MDRVRNLKTPQLLNHGYGLFELVLILSDKIHPIQVIFCLFLKEDVALYRERLPIIFPSLRSEPEGGEENSGEKKGGEEAEEGGASNTKEEKTEENEDLAKL